MYAGALSAGTSRLCRVFVQKPLTAGAAICIERLSRQANQSVRQRVTHAAKQALDTHRFSRAGGRNSDAAGPRPGQGRRRPRGVTVGSRLDGGRSACFGVGHFGSTTPGVGLGLAPLQDRLGRCSLAGGSEDRTKIACWPSRLGSFSMGCSRYFPPLPPLFRFTVSWPILRPSTKRLSARGRRSSPKVR